MTFQIVSAMCSVYLLPAERVRVLFVVVVVVTLRAGSVSTVHSAVVEGVLILDAVLDASLSNKYRKGIHVWDNLKKNLQVRIARQIPAITYHIASAA